MTSIFYSGIFWFRYNGLYYVYCSKVVCVFVCDAPDSSTAITILLSWCLHDWYTYVQICISHVLFSRMRSHCASMQSHHRRDTRVTRDCCNKALLASSVFLMMNSTSSCIAIHNTVWICSHNSKDLLIFRDILIWCDVFFVPWFRRVLNVKVSSVLTDRVVCSKTFYDDVFVF